MPGGKFIIGSYCLFQVESRSYLGLTSLRTFVVIDQSWSMCYAWGMNIFIATKNYSSLGFCFPEC